MKLEKLNIWSISEDVTGIKTGADSGERENCDLFLEYISIPKYTFEFGLYVAADFRPCSTQALYQL